MAEAQHETTDCEPFMGSGEPSAIQAGDHVAPEAPKRKKKKRKTGGRGNGFEEYYADSPMTPAESAEEKSNIYAPWLSFEERIQSCIQRFRGRRRLTGELTRFFDEYLFLGGIDSHASAFTGTDPEELKNMTPAERREALATDAVHGGDLTDSKFYNGNKSQWSVDFAGVAAGYFSTAVPVLTFFEPAKVDGAIGVVENFLRYILHHEVCPEHGQDVHRALQLCATARQEIPMWKALHELLPGSFNSTATFRYVDTDEATSDEGLLSPEFSRGTEAELLLMCSLAMLEEDSHLFDALMQSDTTVAREFECTLVVEDISRPEPDLVEQMQELTVKDEQSQQTLMEAPAIGKVLARACERPENDCDHPELTRPLSSDHMIALFFDDGILKNMKVGMKMDLAMFELDVTDGPNMYFVKAVHKVYPTFYVFLPQELMRHFKEVRPNERPAPSIHMAGNEASEEAQEENV